MTRLGIAAESPADAALITQLADRLLAAAVEWVDGDDLAPYRTWVGIDDGDYVDVHHAQEAARAKGLRKYGHFKGEPAAADAHMMYAILWLYAELPDEDQPEVVVVARDTDGVEERRQGLLQATGVGEWEFHVLPALATPEIEAWRVAAWRPSAHNEARDRAAHAAVQGRLGFDPVKEPTRLTSGKQTDRKDAKRVLTELCEHLPSPEERWAEVSLEHLDTVPLGCGLKEFIDDVRSTLVPRFDPTPRKERP